MPRSLIPEDLLCLLLARANFSAAAAAKATKLIESGPRWELLLERARVHGVTPLVYHRLRAFQFQGVPPRIHRELADTFGVNAMRNLRLSQELAGVLKELDSAGIPVVSLKGPGLAESVYGDVALRVCADLDILIPPQHLENALLRLRSRGYENQFERPEFVQLLAHYGKDCALMRQDARQSYPLQVHCGLIWGGPAEASMLAEIWADYASPKADGAPNFAMGREWEFLYLAIHAARHGFFPAKWLVDLDWFIARGGVDWTEVQKIASRLGWSSILQSCFAACVALFETPIPEPFASEAASPAALAATRQIRARLQASSPGAFEIPRETLFSLRLLPTHRKRLQYLALRLFVPTPADGEFIALPDRLFFLYYFLRPWRLLLSVAAWSAQAAYERARQIFRGR